MSDNNSGGNTLGGSGGNEPLPAGWGRPSAPRVGRIGEWGSSSSSRSTSASGRLATLASLSSSTPGPRPPRGDDDDDGDARGGGEGESWFAGGERSGISVENPDRARVPGGNMVRDILRRAAEAGPPPVPQGTAPSGSFFTGGGHTLGSDEVESTFIPDPNASAEGDDDETAIRHVTFWRNGFSVEDGELLVYGDPANEELLAQLNSGLAPPHILNVVPGQPVELRVAKRLNEDYTPPPKRPSAPFSGSGNRLGAPVPAVSSSGGVGGSGGVMPGSFPGGAERVTVERVERESISTRFEVDQTQPATSVQIRLADGTRMPCRMNLTHTVGDIRSFINASHPENASRAYTIGTTFPNRTLDDDAVTIKDAGLANSVVVQRWV
ncbi:SEP-domain-containing protein [Leucogyrophana mollusca]|uniref:SEP-domain-containing protein n=1 Tax=Leucogyrophana mollusca TaxID=85980 RepID=A0ACB8BJH9_9AGAM|nr:SEP-domain-containing protein [Leucogyrophana mollusca]